ncbi:histidine phosphotransferase family protein [Sinisalibacter lacisalsi]|uniref:Histidine phosphotransferase n=1 Tax=Sinisalibacter lacisalsi TaxID=1526570 RepID=A0ABQ1QMZ8_9RHOB|nr:histidine phosphotransferase family protein [Sinisalibacter lacisalsi]GGD32797.1 histidine phosphotransferase [Sinisalibacter lacisalsi]
MSDAPPDLVALVGTRIAHDLANPIGAIANGVELLALTGQDDSPELQLLAESVANAAARIKAFRIAFGAAPPGQRVKAADIAALFPPGASGHRLAVDWQPEADVPRGLAKLALLGLMCLETAMPRGGEARVTAHGAGYRVTGSGPRLALPEGLRAALDGAPPADLAPAHVHFALLAGEARAQGRALHHEIGSAGISLAF